MHGTTTVILSTLLLTLASFSFSCDSSIYTIVHANFVQSNANPPILTDDVFQVTYLVASVVSACIMAPLLCDFIGRRLTMLLAGILLFTAKRGHAEVVKLLAAEFGADANANDKKEATPIHSAAEGGHTEVVKLLVAKFGADVNAKDKVNTSIFKRQRFKRQFQR